MKYWIQSFLLGVPKIIVGFRTRDGVLVDVNEIDTLRIPDIVKSRPNPRWDGNMCVNFASAFLDCKYYPWAPPWLRLCSCVPQAPSGSRLTAVDFRAPQDNQ